MLLEFSCENFRSIKNKIVFSFVASSDDTYQNNLRIKEDGKLRITRIASLYGANGSGKTSFLQSIAHLKLLVSNSINHQPGDLINRSPHKLSESKNPTTFSCQFIKNNIRYAYGVSYVEEKVTEEYLYHYKNGRPARIFDRSSERINILLGDGLKKDFENAIDVLKENRLFLSCAANFSKNIDIESVFLFFKDDVVVYPFGNSENWFNYTIEVLSKDNELKKHFLKIVGYMGTGIHDVLAKFEKKRFTEKELPADMPNELKQIIIANETNVIDAKIDYGNFQLDLMEESNGMKKLFEVVCPLIDVIIRDKVLVWDEMETSLHPCIVEDLLDLFQNGKKESNSQLLFTTHDINLLNLKRFRRDQIWFTELNENERSTDLYSLSELKNVRKDENIKKGYISGKYGAIPCLNGDMADLFNEGRANG